MSLSYTRHEPQPDTPRVDAKLWVGVRNALLIEAVVFGPLLYWWLA